MYPKTNLRNIYIKAKLSKTQQSKIHNWLKTKQKALQACKAIRKYESKKKENMSHIEEKKQIKTGLELIKC